jgi:hypothetical protein
MRPATGSDVPAISAFLHARIERSMFLAGNLEAHGITGSRAARTGTPPRVPDRRAWRTRSDQPLLRRDLGNRNDRSATIRSATAEDEPRLRAWFARYLV